MPNDFQPISGAPALLPQLRAKPLPIVIIGAGGIVRDAHLPAYRKGSLPVAAIVDRDPERAAAVAREFGIPRWAAKLEDLFVDSPDQIVYDVAVPAARLLDVLPLLPDGAAVLMQKPMGETLAEAEAILTLCRQKSLTAAVNFQLRWAPGPIAARAFYESGRLGQLHDIDFEISTHMPWELWSFLARAPRLEILYHSIHYIDLARAWLGNPLSVYAKTVRNPRTPLLAATKSTIILDYGEWMRVTISANHSQDFSAATQQSTVQWEGTKNALRYRMGVNLNYPAGLPDTLTLFSDGEDSAQPRDVPLSGNWFPDAFLGSMLSLQSYTLGEAAILPTSVEDAIDTMRVVEAAYLSSERGGVSLSEVSGSQSKFATEKD
jgi:predicted dehydrogenase